MTTPRRPLHSFSLRTLFVAVWVATIAALFALPSLGPNRIHENQRRLEEKASADNAALDAAFEPLRRVMEAWRIGHMKEFAAAEGESIFGAMPPDDPRTTQDDPESAAPLPTH